MYRIFCLFGFLAVPVWAQVTPPDALLEEEFVYVNVPFPQCHASTLVETEAGTLVAAWFGGKEEGDKGVGIWVSRKEKGGKWSQPVEVANGIQSETLRYPCWNPVLYLREEGTLVLFFKVGPSPPEWWGETLLSTDDGKTWENRQKLPDGFLGPVKNKAVRLADGTILAPTSSEEKRVWRIYFEWSRDGGKTWGKTPFLHTAEECQGIQPTILFLKDGTLRMLARNRGGNILTATSADGVSWSSVSTLDLPNPDSGIDAVTLRDGRHVLVYNPVSRGRNILALALSEDGISWKTRIILESTPGQEYSYPAVIQTSDGRLHILYTWRRVLVKHLVLDVEKL